MGTVALGVSGQACIAQTRAIVHRDVYDEFLMVAMGMTSMINYGDPFDDETTASPLISAKQVERVLNYVDLGHQEGARLVCGGSKPEGPGNFVLPTIFADVSNNMRVAREEIFGPILCVVPFSDEEEAIRLANDTEYGLGATVYTNAVNRAMRMARALRAGTVGVNGYQLEPNAPFGGYGHSGMGREGVRTAIEAYTEVKTVLIPTTDELM
jgi:aldehyde dehydrogenase (NAD+)